MIKQGYMTIQDAIRAFGLTHYFVKKLADSGALTTYHFNSTRAYYDPAELKEYAKIKSVKNSIKFESVYGDIALAIGESIRLIDFINSPRELYKSPLDYKTRFQYAVSNKGRVFDLTHGRELTKTISTNGYAQVSLALADGGRVSIDVAKLVALYWTEHGRLDQGADFEVHHINKIRTDDRPENLIIVTKPEHVEAHRLLRVADESGDRREYDEYIERLHRLNRWTEKQIEKGIRCVIGTDFLSSAGCVCFAYVTDEFARALYAGERTWKGVTNDDGYVLYYQPQQDWQDVILPTDYPDSSVTDLADRIRKARQRTVETQTTADEKGA